MTTSVLVQGTGIAALVFALFLNRHGLYISEEQLAIEHCHTEGMNMNMV
jgi:hypothetical protein